MNAKEILQESYSRVTLIPVIGSGISIPFGLPDWRMLIEKAADYFCLSAEMQQEISTYLDNRMYLEAVDVILSEGISESALQQFVSESMLSAKRTAGTVENNYSDLAKMPKIRFMTTNYDEYINDIVGVPTFHLEELEEIKVNQFSCSPYDHAVIPLHGEISRPESIVLSRKSYEDLYHSDKFNDEFQQLRTRFTFLFLGFSFDDEYFQSLFDKVVQRFEAQHYILFEKSVGIRNKEKIEALWEKYGVEAMFFDASDGNYTRAISSWLGDIFKLRDVDADLTVFEQHLDEEKAEQMSEAEAKLVGAGREYIRQEMVTEVYKLYWPEYSSESFIRHSADYQLEIANGLLWCYGYQRMEKEAMEFLEAALRNPVIDAGRSKLTFMYAQLMWNVREFAKGIEILEQYGGNKKMSCLLLDLIKCYREFLPERAEKEESIPVYGPEKRTPEEENRYKSVYADLKSRYINEDTYNLLNLDSYGDRQEEQIAYYWLGLAAGQLFHEHFDSVQYLLRSYELSPQMAVCEELGQNYFALAQTEIRYEERPKKYQLNMNYLLKAQIRFQYVMNFSDEQLVHSMYEKSGLAYLQTLFWLGNFIAFYEFYDKSKEYIPQTEELMLLKAEADAQYTQKVDEAVLAKLNPADQSYIRYRCAMHRAEAFEKLNFWESIRIRRSILYRAEEEQPLTDPRIVMIVLDTAFFLKDKEYYEKMKQIYPSEYFADMKLLGLEDELYGNLDEAVRHIKEAFEKYKDYDGTFRIVRDFYVRNRMREEYLKLYAQVLADPPDEMYRRSQFFADRIMGEAVAWNNPWGSLALYKQYHSQIQEDLTVKKELEEGLKPLCVDYSDYENRIAWNRYMLSKVPGHLQFQFYDSILKLYTANMQYKKALDVVDEMKQKGIPIIGAFDAVIQVCLRKQSKNYYINERPYYSSDKEYLGRILREVRCHWKYNQYGFGAVDMELVLPVKYLLCIFRENRQRELNSVKKVHIMYTGLIHLMNSLRCREDPFLRMILQWLGRAGNVVLVAPDFLDVCEYVPAQPNKEHRAEDIQLKLYCREHPNMIRI